MFSLSFLRCLARCTHIAPSALRMKIRANMPLSPSLVPPEWISKPKDQEAVEGEDVFFPCSVSGVPEPMITWRKMAGESGETFLTHSLTGSDFLPPAVCRRWL